MKPLSEWTVAEITSEIGRYKARQEWLREDFAERIKSLDEGIEPLEAELVRRPRLAETSATTDTSISDRT